MKETNNSSQDQVNLESLLNKEEETQNLQEIIAPYLMRWKWFVLSVIVAFALLFVYLRYADKVYRVNSTAILKDQNKTTIRGGNAIFSGLDIAGTVNNIDNEIEVIRSKSIVIGVVNQLNLHTSYLVKGRIKVSDLYTSSPVTVAMSQEDLDSLKAPLRFTVVRNADKSISISRMERDELTKTEKEHVKKILQLPVLYNTSAGKVTLALRPEVSWSEGSPIEVVISPPAQVVNSYRSRLAVSPTSKTTSVLNMQLTTTEPKKGIDFLNKLVAVYNQESIADKMREALNTKDFIDERIAIIDRELGDAERTVEQFKRTQGLTDLQSDVQLSMQKGSQYEQKLVEVSTQLNLVEHLSSYISNMDNKNRLVPTNVGVNDPTLTATINEYNKSVLERDRLLRSNTESNPVIQRIDTQIEGLRDAIGTSIASTRQGLGIARRDAQSQVNFYRGQTGMAPTQERQYTEYAREQQIKNSLFLMLLQKREENALSLSISANSAKILDSATAFGPVSPKKQILALAALLLGLLVPFLIIYLRDLLHYTIESRMDVEKNAKITILGEIPASKIGNIAVSENGNKETDEAFRMLRTNLLFMLGKGNKVVLVSSTEPKEGKTFVAINTAISLSLLGKKVVLIGLDLRLPRMSEYLQINNEQGMSQYLSGYVDDINKIVQPSNVVPNLWVISAGTVPPNPSELIAKETLDTAIDELKKKFDFIVIDSAPVSRVTDTVVAARVADASVYVVRANYSHRNNLLFANELNDKNLLPNMGLLVNDVSNYHFGYGRLGYGKAGYGYGYGYGYGNGKERKKRKLLRKEK